MSTFLGKAVVVRDVRVLSPSRLWRYAREETDTKSSCYSSCCNERRWFVKSLCLVFYILWSPKLVCIKYHLQWWDLSKDVAFNIILLTNTVTLCCSAVIFWSLFKMNWICEYWQCLFVRMCPTDFFLLLLYKISLQSHDVH